MARAHGAFASPLALCGDGTRARCVRDPAMKGEGANSCPARRERVWGLAFAGAAVWFTLGAFDRLVPAALTCG